MVLDHPSGFPADVQLFEIFSDQVASIIGTRQYLPPEDMVSLQVALVNLALKCYPNKVEYIDKVMLSTVKIFQRMGLDRLESNSMVARELSKLLKIPLDHYNNLLTVLKLQHYAGLMQHLDYPGRKLLSIYILTNALDSETIITTQEEVEQALSLVSTLVTDQNDQPSGEIDLEELSEEQSLLARFVHQFSSNVLDQQYLILITARKVRFLYFIAYLKVE